MSAERRGRASKDEADTTGETTSRAKPRKRVVRTFYLNQELLDRARAAVTHLAAYRPEAGVRSLSDVFEPGGWAEVERLEAEYNKGKPFKPVAKMPTGRPQQAD